MEQEKLNPAKPISVLMVEDDITFVKIVEHHLEKFPSRRFQLTWKESVEAAIAELSAGKMFDIIITDYNFPTSSGLEFALYLNQVENTIPVLFLTGTRDFKLAIEAMKLGIEDYLLKEDLSDSSLPRNIINVIDRVRMRDQLQAVEKRMTIAENRAQAIRELVVTVCHEFNNPLAAVKISSDFVQRMMSTPDVDAMMVLFNKHFQKIEMEIKRLRDINFEQIQYQNINLAHPS